MNEIWHYWSSGREMFAVVNPNDISKNIINNVRNRQTIGETNSEVGTFKDEKSLREHIKDSEYNLYSKRL